MRHFGKLVVCSAFTLALSGSFSLAAQSPPRKEGTKQETNAAAKAGTPAQGAADKAASKGNAPRRTSNPGDQVAPEVAVPKQEGKSVVGSVKPTGKRTGKPESVAALKPANQRTAKLANQANSKLGRRPVSKPASQSAGQHSVSSRQDQATKRPVSGSAPPLQQKSVK